METPSQILIFARWENVYFRIRLAQMLRERFPDVSIQFLTLFSFAHKEILAAGEKSTYLLPEMEQVRGDELSDDQIDQIDRDVYHATGANLNLMLVSERELPPNRRSAEWFRYKHLAVLDRLIGVKTLTIHESFDSYIYWLAGGLAIARGGWDFAFVSCAIPSNSVLCKRTAWTTWINEMSTNQGISLADARAELQKPIEQRMGYKRIGKADTWGKWLSYQSMVLKHCLIDAHHGAYFFPFSGLVPAAVTRLSWGLKKRLKRIPYTIRNVRQIEEISQDLIYMPLQFEPEASILAYSPWLRDQAEAVRLVCQSMPVGWRLLVKENHWMVGRRTRAFYRDVLKLPGVELVHHEVPTIDLLQRASAVVAVTGTATFEARILGKQGFALGSPPFHRMLSDSDIAGRLKLRDLFGKLIAGECPPLTDAEFDRWKLSTFEARGSMFWQGAYRGLDASDENVGKYVEYIMGVLANPQHTEVE